MTSRIGKAAAIGAAALVLTLAGSASPALAGQHCRAHSCWPGWAPDPPLHIEVVSAWDCEGVLVAKLTLETLRGTAWTPRRDDGAEKIQLHFIGNGLGSVGAWETVDSASTKPGTQRFDLRTGGLPTYEESLRLVRTDGSQITSTPQPVQSGCPKA